MPRAPGFQKLAISMRNTVRTLRRCTCISYRHQHLPADQHTNPNLNQQQPGGDAARVHLSSLDAQAGREYAKGGPAKPTRLDSPLALSSSLVDQRWQTQTRRRADTSVPPTRCRDGAWKYDMDQSVRLQESRVADELPDRKSKTSQSPSQVAVPFPIHFGPYFTMTTDALCRNRDPTTTTGALLPPRSTCNFNAIHDPAVPAQPGRWWSVGVPVPQFASHVSTRLFRKPRFQAGSYLARWSHFCSGAAKTRMCRSGSDEAAGPRA
ncbi:hypothetical protein CORC01_08171 [Colletotrichum orchidophilum]|uniref:Uncharacterized protein n=1 Tax=Colletotrichum orchidophilum TaxID=1209926 RepID=A0A1G4B5I7_9PEZI|nr:uncharacterized protein CORC01_08171 [Colletotrichum orchidophilum]OHE96573.1 hypothetical protein CORC01_08171 [Colletotrichum orchidophilum]